MAERGNGGIIGPANVPNAATASGVWNLEEQQAAKSLAAWPSDYRIQRSLRFNSADSAYLNRTPASAGNRTTWTWSAWVKKAGFGVFQVLFTGGAGTSDETSVYFDNFDRLIFVNANSSVITGRLITTQVFRDPSSWYHIVATWDSTNATGGNRMRLYVNGQEVTAFSEDTIPAQNTTSSVNNAVAHHISYTGAYIAGYMTEVNFIDGQALTPSSFGQTNANTGVWEPKPYAGTYGTNGFYLNFSDNSNTTATTLGKDYSGNGNNWTPNNFSVSAGAGNDSLVDVPTAWGTDTGVGGTVRGNYCTLNPVLQNAYWASPNRATLTNGNLDAGGSPAAAFSTFEVPTNQKIYFEVTCVNKGNTVDILIAAANRNTFELNYLSTGQKQLTGAVNSNYGASWGTGDIIGVAIDRASNTATFYKNGVSQGAITQTFPSETVLVGAYMEATPVAVSFNFGQRPFAYTAPSGFKALCTQNLPTPTIGATAATQADDYFNAVLYTGDRTDRTITVGFQPDWVWVKSRSAADDHYLMNSLSGTGKYLVSNSTAAEATNANVLTAFTSGGFSVGNTGTTNETGRTYVAWNWKANGAGVTNTAGSITSTVSANTTSGFSVVTYTGTGTLGTVGHGLGVAPAMIIIKRRNGAVDWDIYHRSIGNGQYISLNLTNAAASSAWLNNTSPSSTVFTLNGGSFAANTSGATLVAYCFAEVPGFSKFGSYTGNNSTDGPFAYCGFRPAWLLVKRTGNVAGWFMVDNKRNTYNLVNNYLYANATDAEAQYPIVDFLSNGFKVRMADTSMNAPGETYIFAAFAEAPQKFALAR